MKIKFWQIVIFAIIVIVVIEGSYFLWFRSFITYPTKEESVIISLKFPDETKMKDNSKNQYIIDRNKLDTLIKTLNKIEGEQKNLNKQFKVNENLTVSTLNGFYSSLFTAIAVIAAILALIGWKWMKESSEKLEKFKKIEEKVDRLHKKKDLADWAKNAVAGPERSSITSFDIKYSKNEENKIKDIIATLSDEYTENGWLEVIYSKEIFKSRNNKERFRKSFNIFNFLIQRDMISNNQDISLEGVVYHFLGQLFWKYYIDKRDDFYKKNGSNVIDFEKWKKERIEDIRENDKIIKKDDEKKNVQEQSDNKNDTQIQNDKNAEISLIECLEISNKYYKKAFDIRERRNEKRDETLGNLAVVLIELAKIDNTNQKKCLKDAKNYLDKVVDKKEDTFTTYWDLARHYYYIDKTEKNGTIKDYLFKAIDKVKTIGQRDTILKGIKDEYHETEFPGDQKLIEELEKRLDQKKYLKNEE